MIDCHCHLACEEFDEDIDEVVSRAKNAGVKACIVVTEHIGEFEKAISLAKRYPGFLIPCAGVHPVQNDKIDGKLIPRSVVESDMNNVEDWLAKHQSELVAIGEVGLDHTPRYLKSESDKDIQEKVLIRQIEIAKRFNIPLNVHSRSAGKHVINCLIENGAKNVVLHAFSGNFKSATAGIAAGYYFSVPPCSARSDQKLALFEKIPLEQLLLETDSPVLGLEPDVRNEPANIHISAEFLAKIKNVDVEKVIHQTTENAFRLFGKLERFIDCLSE